MLTADNERDPEPHHVEGRLDDAADVEELRLSERPMVVVDRDFDDTKTRILDLLHQLETDHAARLFQPNALEDRAAHQAEVAVDVAHRQAKQDAHDVMVEAADD